MKLDWANKPTVPGDYWRRQTGKVLAERVLVLNVRGGWPAGYQWSLIRPLADEPAVTVTVPRCEGDQTTSRPLVDEPDHFVAVNKMVEPFTLEVGKRYKCRDGSVVTIRSNEGGWYEFAGDNDWVYYPNGRCYFNAEHSKDIIGYADAQPGKTSTSVPLGEDGTSFSAWLLETTIGGSPVWYTEANTYRDLTTNAFDAKHFTTKEDALAYIEAHDLDNWRATEHGFDPGPAAAPSPRYASGQEPCVGDVIAHVHAPNRPYTVSKIHGNTFSVVGYRYTDLPPDVYTLIRRASPPPASAEPKSLSEIYDDAFHSEEDARPEQRHAMGLEAVAEAVRRHESKMEKTAQAAWNDAAKMDEQIAKLTAERDKIKGEQSRIIGIVQVGLQPDGSPPSLDAVNFVHWIVKETLNKIDALSKEIGVLTVNLSKARDQRDAASKKIAELERQLANAGTPKQWNDLVDRNESLTQQLADAKAEIERLKET